MIVSVAILSRDCGVFYANFLPTELKNDISKHASNFLYSINIEDDQMELPYIETTNLRYIYKQSGDLYWLVVTKTESDMFTDINILGRFVCTILEYGSTETDSTSLTDEQCDLFYRHIWRAWDECPECSVCGCHCKSPAKWERDFESRLDFLIDIRNGRVDEIDVNYFNGLIADSWQVAEKLNPRWFTKGNSSGSDSPHSNDSDNQSISEEAVIYGCRMKCRLEDIQVASLRLQDPYLRLFARRDLLNGSRYNPIEKQIGSAPALQDSFDQLQSDL